MEPARVVKVDVLQDKARQLGVTFGGHRHDAERRRSTAPRSRRCATASTWSNVTGRATAAERASIDTLRDLQLTGLERPVGAARRGGHICATKSSSRRSGAASRLPTITLKASIVDNVQPKTVVDQLAPKVAEFAKGLPAGYSVAIGGSVEESAKSQAPIVAVVPLMLFVMATILMIQLQSFHRLFLVFAVAPLALIGVVMALLPSGAPLGFVAILGVLALIGILIRNSVILIVQIEDLRKAGRPAWDAVVEATEHRMRPIMLTAAAASLALIPIAREIFWGPMAYAMMGGIIVGTRADAVVPAGALCGVVPDQGAGARNGQHSRKSACPRIASRSVSRCALSARTRKCIGGPSTWPSTSRTTRISEKRIAASKP